MNCLRCGFANAAGNRFCGRCGESLEPPPPDDGERRPITFVMCDLVGSTQLAQALDLDDWHALLGDYHTLCGDALRRHDGHAAQVLGDGVLFYFGWPHAHEDDARRAVQCGLDILDALQARNRSPARAVDMELHVRIGVHTGRAVVSTVRVGPHHEHLAQGDAPNIAARVQSVAPADALVASEATWRLVRHHFHGDDLGPHELKGVAQPVALWRVVAARAPSPHFQPEATLTAYVGRQAELDALAQHWQAARAGTARFVVLSGDAGIGKSRLVEEFRRRLAGEDQQVFDLRCTPYAQTSAFLPVTQLLAECLGLERTQPPPERLERLERGLAAWDIAAPDAVPLLAELLSIPCDSRHPAPELSPARRRTRMLEILVAALQRMAAARPTLLIAEDLHWADPSTVDLLQLVVSSVSRLRLLGLFTARTEFRPPWPAGETAPTLQLSRLTDEEVEAVVHDVAHGKRVPGELSREIAQRCDGVPLFVEEMMRAVIEAGAMREGAHAWELTAPLGHALIPPSIDASLMARIDRLGDARATAQLGAAIGREFTHALIRSVSDRGEDELAQDLRR
ncbi:MAG TPA: AAA family ATPase, partial [Albitalea sp.]